VREFEVQGFLDANTWISKATISSRSIEKGIRRIQIELSPAGHYLIRDSGMQEFSQRIHSQLQVWCDEEIGWEIRPVRGQNWSQEILDSERNLPRILSWIDEFSQQRLLMEVSPDLSYFRGHFPGNPVLPGVVQVHWAVVFSCKLYGVCEVPPEIKRLKFKSVVAPPRIMELSLSRPGANEVQFEYSSLGQQHSLGRLIFTAEDPC